MTETQQQKLSEIATLKQRALSFPRGLADARQRHGDAARRQRELKAEIADAEKEAEFDAAMARDDQGKLRYSNAEQRKAAAGKALADSAVHRERLKRLSDAEGDALTAQIEVARLEDEHRAYRTIVDLTVAEIQLLVAGR